jgi:hypothetical protein
MLRPVSLLLVASLLSTTSCSLFSPSSQNVNILPSHPAAQVYVDGNLVGTGPQSVRLKKSSSHSVLVKCGTSAGTGVIDRELSTTGILDIIGGFIIIIPFFGLLAPGSHSLSPDTLSVAIPDATTST